jgi:trimethylamine--corrinoid protein Co-methyltransferase
MQRQGFAWCLACTGMPVAVKLEEDPPAVRIKPGSVSILSEAEVGAIHRAALHILSEVGMWIENDTILRHLQAHGGEVDHARQRVRYSRVVVERFLADSERFDWQQATPGVSASAGVYHGLYLEPESGDLVPWTEERLAGYLALAAALPNVGRATMLGSRLHPSSVLEPLWERYYGWKYGAYDGCSIHLDELCPFIYDLCQLRAEQVRRPLAEVFRGTAYLVPPLKVGRHEAYQFLYFYERGLQVSLGDQYALGATAPVTLAGAIALSLAEQLALGILQRAFFGGRRFGLGASISPMDMRTMIYPYGRPEMAAANLAMAQMARQYGLPFAGHAGLSDAKTPSCEAGAQKALTAIPTLLAGGRLHVDAGLLSTDEVCSPLQLILDDEFIGALQHLCAEFPATEEELALDLIAEVGPGGHFFATQHTARHFRREQWQPRIWSRETLARWLEGDRTLDVDRARALYRDLRPSLPIGNRLTPEEEADILALIGDAHKHLLGTRMG